MRLLEAAAGDSRILLHCFSLPSVKRSQPAKSRVDTQYTDIADLGRLKIDGLIVTGAEPNAATLPEEPFWQDLTEIIDWAEANTRSTIWSCLAAHAAVLHLDGIERHRLNAKCSGVFDCTKTGDHWLTENVASPLKVVAFAPQRSAQGRPHGARLSGADRIAGSRRRHLRQAVRAAISSSFRGIRNTTPCRCSGNICATSPASSRANGIPIRPSLPAISTSRPKAGLSAFRSGHAPSASCR